MPTSDGYVAIGADGVVPVTIAGDVIAISPDGTALATERVNRLELIARATSTSLAESSADEGEPEPIDIGRAGRTIFFADL